MDLYGKQLSPILTLNFQPVLAIHVLRDNMTKQANCAPGDKR